MSDTTMKVTGITYRAIGNIQTLPDISGVALVGRVDGAIQAALDAAGSSLARHDFTAGVQEACAEAATALNEMAAGLRSVGRIN